MFRLYLVINLQFPDFKWVFVAHFLVLFFSSLLFVMYCTPNYFFVICLFKKKAEEETNTQKNEKKTYEIYTDKRHLIYKHIYSVPLQ